jgi:hypothetical protein
MTITQPVSMTRVASPFGVGDDLSNRLPKQGRARLQWLRDQRQELHTVLLALSDKQRESNLDKQRAAAQLHDFLASYEGRNITRHDPEHVALVSREQAVKRAENDLATITPRLEQSREAWTAHATLLERVERYLEKLPGEVTPFTGKDKPRKGEAPAEGVARIRGTIADLQTEIDSVRQAPPPASEITAAVRAQVEALAERGKPLITGDGIVTWPHRIDLLPAAESYLSVRVDDTLALTAWLHKDALIAALTREIEARTASGKAMSAEQRTAKLEELGAALLAAEREDVTLVFASNGAILPRPDTDPRAVLALADSAPGH